MESQAGISWLQGRSWLAEMRRATNLSYSVGQPTSILSHDPRTPATRVAKRRARGRNSQNEQNGRRLAYANLYKKLYEF